jgi:hypothetical protein
VHYDEPGASDETIPDCPVAWHVQHRYTVVGNHQPSLTLLGPGATHDQKQIAVEVFEGLRLQVLSPSPDQTFDLFAEVKASAIASRPIASVTASVGTTTQSLAGNNGSYTGTLKLPPNQTSMDLVVRAQTTAGETAESTVHIYQAQHPPTLTIHAPLPATVARPTLDLDLACGGDTPTCNITVEFGPFGSLGKEIQLVSGGAQVQTTVDLGQWDGLEGSITMTASNAHGSTIVTRDIVVEGSRWYKELQALPEAILDADLSTMPWRFVRVDQAFGDTATDWAPQHIDPTKPFPVALHVDGQPDTRIFDGMIHDGFEHSYSDWVRLVPGAVLYQTMDQNGIGRLTRWAGKADAAYPVPAEAVSLSGDYLAFSFFNGAQVHLESVRNSTGVVTVLPDGDDEIGISSDGVVARASISPNPPSAGCGTGTLNSKLFLGDKLLASEPNSYYSNLQTDGKTVVYWKRSYVGMSCNETLQVAMNDGSSETLLGPTAPAANRSTNGGELIKMNNGWIAFVLPDQSSQYTELWRRSPTGTLERIVKTSSDLWLEGLGDDGSMMYMVDWFRANQRSFVGPSGRTTLVGHGLGRAFFYQGKWYILIGRSLFQMVQPQ